MAFYRKGKSGTGFCAFIAIYCFYWKSNIIYWFDLMMTTKKKKRNTRRNGTQMRVNTPGENEHGILKWTEIHHYNKRTTLLPREIVKIILNCSHFFSDLRPTFCICVRECARFYVRSFAYFMLNQLIIHNWTDVNAKQCRLSSPKDTLAYASGNF